METEYITDDLKSLVPYGAQPHLIALRFNLCSALGVDTMSTYRAIGSYARTLLKDQINSLADGVFHGRVYPADTLGKCFRTLLGFEHSSASVDNRRMIVMRQLGIAFPMQTWRKGTGHERQLLHLLAERLTT